MVWLANIDWTDNSFLDEIGFLSALDTVVALPDLNAIFGVGAVGTTIHPCLDPNRGTSP